MILILLLFLFHVFGQYCTFTEPFEFATHKYSSTRRSSTIVSTSDDLNEQNEQNSWVRTQPNHLISRWCPKNSWYLWSSATSFADFFSSCSTSSSPHTSSDFARPFFGRGPPTAFFKLMIQKWNNLQSLINRKTSRTRLKPPKPLALKRPWIPSKGSSKKGHISTPVHSRYIKKFSIFQRPTLSK